MDKASGAFRTIGEMARILGVKTHILRYWEEQFPMLQPLKRAGGRRHYRSDDVALLQTINRLLNSEGYTIKGARKYLENGARAHSSATNGSGKLPNSDGAPVPADSNAVSIDALKAIRARLADALAAA
ncbi:MerR family transcriptional regulator [Sphingorhabdus arenilitoris]|uniref:MerR family transcriptional regulator n=1 Tax=Sphingorhabdus arenilitoris TaxID=1490041 RepID=A0ABV8RL53_9SPHN